VQHVTLAIILGGIGDSTSKNTWRYPEAAKALYFEQLAKWVMASAR
jgi:ParB family chromosome partitioning protein